MKSNLPEIDELKILLELVREAQRQIEAGCQPKLGGLLEEQGFSQKQTKTYIEQWSQLITELLAESPTDPVTLSERKDSLQTGALRLLFACLVPNYSERYLDDPTYSQSPENEQRLAIELTPEEIRHLLRISLLDAAWSK